MVTKLQNKSTAKKTQATPKDAVKDSVQQIWDAGVSALAKVQAEGTKAIEALIKEGVSMQRKTQSAAEEKINEASSRMSNMATDISSKASGQWDKLESIFEDRVAKALNKLGVPSAKDINALVARVEELNKSVQKMSAKGGSPKAVAKKTAKSTAKPTAKKVARTRSKRTAAAA